jgi:hypothetical protein
MRPLLAVCALAFIGVSAGFAGSGDAATRLPVATGDGCLVVQDGYGVVTVNVVKGVLFGRVGGGVVTVEDTVVGDGLVPAVRGYQRKTKLEDKTRYESDTTMRFRAARGAKVTINGYAMNLSFVGRGWAVVSTGGFQVSLPDTNLFSVDSASFCEDNFEDFPTKPTRYTIADSTG